ncbi:LytR/AlgR family response regulator transcription factor [Pedobacter psychroterrae]|uniref:Response regulator transcription factor n=1 Tax=Pedobacter psychroterrae TaxID=2530453 RepID=A0A4R0NHU4_9SPHI|nr:LytTR family DNA-binding domain-containing protein [Pedobacter psychroterrae]TCD00200.1 response regulator transcription factor [Pedobacter psychroterrae]
MNKIHCLIVDDEPIARDIIQNYCQHLDYLNVVASCGNALEAKAIMQTTHIDILFLDINMPVMDGISFLKTLKNPAQVIFTTAYKEYAIDAFDLAACDYLLKPFSFERFIMAIDKATDKLQPAKTRQEGSSIPASQPGPIEDFTFIKTDGKIYKLSHHDLLYAEAQGNYTRIVTTSNTLMPKMPFSSFEELLPASTFLRVHRSFIINKSKIDHIEGNRLFINNTEIPIGSNYKDQLMKELGFPKA